MPETSGYGALATLLNEIGHHLKPKVQCSSIPPTAAPASPTAACLSQTSSRRATEQLPGQLPQRGAIEVKPPSTNARVVARGDQVTKYLEKYRQVLVTSYREFVLVGYDAEGRRSAAGKLLAGIERGRLLDTRLAPRKAAVAHGERLAEFLGGRCCVRRRLQRRKSLPGF